MGHSVFVIIWADGTLVVVPGDLGVLVDFSNHGNLGLFFARPVFWFLGDDQMIVDIEVAGNWLGFTAFDNSNDWTVIRELSGTDLELSCKSRFASLAIDRPDDLGGIVLDHDLEFS